MSARWTQEDLAKLPQAMRQAPLVQAAKRPPKYRNVRVEFQGKRFDSQRELKVWQELELLRIRGEVRAVIRQVSLPLQGTIRRIRIDFLVIGNDGSYTWKDAKGFDTAMGQLKRQQVKDAYGIEVQLC